MSSTYRKYINNEDHNWYNSSNIVYSVCFDTNTINEKQLKIVFKGGRTYLYKAVDPIDYVMFRAAESQGKEFNERIKKYDCVRLNDTNLDQLQKMKDEFIAMDSRSEYRIGLILNDETGEFHITINDNKVFEGVEGQVSVVNLFTAMGLEYEYKTDENCHNQTIDDFCSKDIIK